MADALVSAPVGIFMLLVGICLLIFSAKKSAENFDSLNIPLMGVLGAFIFAGQMINFAIPLTGSSGHISGGILLAAMLGAYPAFIVLSCVLIIQSLFFADGGILALGCNIFNLVFFTCFIGNFSALVICHIGTLFHFVKFIFRRCGITFLSNARMIC